MSMYHILNLVPSYFPWLVCISIKSNYQSVFYCDDVLPFLPTFSAPQDFTVFLFLEHLDYLIEVLHKSHYLWKHLSLFLFNDQCDWFIIIYDLYFWCWYELFWFCTTIRFIWYEEAFVCILVHFLLFRNISHNLFYKLVFRFFFTISFVFITHHVFQNGYSWCLLKHCVLVKGGWF